MSRPSELPSPSQKPPSHRRPRGAPPGNRNALKHGFYSRHFKKIDLTDLDQSTQVGLQDEISMLRVFIRRILELGCAVDDLSEALGLLRTLSLATATLTRLIKTQHWLSSNHDDVSAAINQAILEVSQLIETGQFPPPSLPSPPDPQSLVPSP